MMIVVTTAIITTLFTVGVCWVAIWASRQPTEGSAAIRILTSEGREGENPNIRKAQQMTTRASSEKLSGVPTRSLIIF